MCRELTLCGPEEGFEGISPPVDDGGALGTAYIRYQIATRLLLKQESIDCAGKMVDPGRRSPR
jgi:hypothetical protein